MVRLPYPFVSRYSRTHYTWMITYLSNNDQPRRLGFSLGIAKSSPARCSCPKKSVTTFPPNTTTTSHWTTPPRDRQPVLPLSNVRCNSRSPWPETSSSIDTCTSQTPFSKGFQAQISHWTVPLQCSWVVRNRQRGW